MDIALIGATGLVGSWILAESLERGHAVTAIVRGTSKLAQMDRVKAVHGDATDLASLSATLAGCEAVISAFNPGKDPGGAGPQAIVDATKQAGVARLLVVGGAGSLEIAPGQRLVDQPDFPAEWKRGALATAAFLDLLRNEEELDWVFVSPAAMLVPERRTGTYRVGGDRLLIDDCGDSRISFADYAVAMVDELERPRHHRARICVAY